VVEIRFATVGSAMNAMAYIMSNVLEIEGV
jgi:hypothetical protein